MRGRIWASKSLSSSDSIPGFGWRSVHEFDPAKKAVIVSLQKEGFNLSHGIEHDTNDNQHAGTTEEGRNIVGNVGCLEDKIRKHSDDRKKD